LSRAALIGALFLALCLAGPAARAAPSANERLAQARALQQKGSSNEARALFESLLPELREHGDAADLASASMSLSQMALGQGDYVKAAQWADQAREAFESAGDQAGRIRAVNNVGLADLYRGAYPSALLHFEEALALSRSRGDAEAEIEELNNVGNVHYYQARYLDALHVFREALEKVDGAGAAPWAARRRRTC